MADERWHEDDEFWMRTAPFLFSSRRWSQAGVEVDAMLSLLDLKPPARVLDLCCGPGRHALELARRGFEVTGVDRTQAYLDEAQRRADVSTLKLELVRQDMRTFKRANFFDAAINISTSFGFFEDPKDDEKVLANVYESLKPGGKFLIDVMGKEILARVFCERDWYTFEDALFLDERKVLDDWARIESRWIIIRDGGREEFTIRLRLYSGAELKTALKRVGFSDIKAFGTLEGAPYDQNAKRLIAIATK